MVHTSDRITSPDHTNPRRRPTPEAYSEPSNAARHGQNERKSKNALFAGHDEGAAAWGRIASLIETCKMNRVEPYAWLKSTLEKIAAGHPQSKIHELLPWNFEPETD